MHNFMEFGCGVKVLLANKQIIKQTYFSIYNSKDTLQQNKKLKLS